jgi:hypothetical protein
MVKTKGDEYAGDSVSLCNAKVAAKSDAYKGDYGG